MRKNLVFRLLRESFNCVQTTVDAAAAMLIWIEWCQKRALFFADFFLRSPQLRKPPFVFSWRFHNLPFGEVKISGETRLIMSVGDLPLQRGGSKYIYILIVRPPGRKTKVRFVFSLPNGRFYCFDNMLRKRSHYPLWEGFRKVIAHRLKRNKITCARFITWLPFLLFFQNYSILTGMIPDKTATQDCITIIFLNIIYIYIM